MRASLEPTGAAVAWGLAVLAGTEAPRLASEIILAHVLGITRERLLAHPESTLEAAAAERYRALVDRHARGEPLAYLLGRREFFNLEFEVSPEVLIPRPETELVVERALAYARPHGAPLRFADVGTGSGCIAIALAAEIGRASGWATDLSMSALEVARANAARLGVADRIVFVRGDLLEPIGARPELDLVVSNPPYVARADAASLPRSVREHEPELALFGGDSGLEVFCRLIPQAAARLAARGILALEVGLGQAREVAQLVEEAGLEVVEIASDLQGIPRCIVARDRG